MTLSINIIGAGNLGKTVGFLFHTHQLLTIKAIYNRSEQRAQQASQFIGAGRAYHCINQLPYADITLITTPDDVIAAVCRQLVDNHCLSSGSIVVHCSGSLTSDALRAARTHGCLVASAHPMRSFAHPETSIHDYNPTYCALEGDEQALVTLAPLFQAIGSVTYIINSEKKSLYHAAGVFASNYLVTLAEQARLCLTQAGVESNMAMAVITSLMHGTLTNLANTKQPALSLTGPLQRGDIATVQQHLTALATRQQQALYALLAQATLSLTTHDPEKKALIHEVLMI